MPEQTTGNRLAGMIAGVIDSESGPTLNGGVTPEQLVIFVKAPRAGSVKTRLAETVGLGKAREAYCEMVQALLQNLSRLKHVELRHTPDDVGEEIKNWVKPGWTAAGQGEGDLGERMARTFDQHFAAGAQRVVIIGSDAPEVRNADIRNAFRELRAHDVVAGPATDGGYWLIGLRAPHPELFRDIKWSSELVLGQTLQKARAHSLSIQLLRILSDIDTANDWENWQTRP